MALTSLQDNAEEAAQNVGQQEAQRIDAAEREEQEQRRQFPLGDLFGEASEQRQKERQSGKEQQKETGQRKKSEPRNWELEVVDVRLTSGPVEGDGTGWLAYGTLAWQTLPGDGP